MMAGIVFFKTGALAALEEFYTRRLGMRVWLRQTDCTILQHGNLMLGFCARGMAERSGMITFFYESKDEVDAMHEELKDIAQGPPGENAEYRIYQFFAHDPEGRILEFQCFLHPVEM